jgi:hypothetical protein
VLFSTNTVPGRFDAVREVEVYLGHSPTAQPPYSFEFEMSLTEPVWAPGNVPLFTEAWLYTPGGRKQLLYATHVHGYQDDSLMFVDRNDNLQPLREAWPNGNQLLVLQFNNGDAVVTPFLFGVPDSGEPLPFPEQQPVITAPEPSAAVYSPVSFSWDPVIDEVVNAVVLGVAEEDGETILQTRLAPTATGYEPTPVAPGSYRMLLALTHAYPELTNADGIPFTVAGYRATGNSFSVLESPTVGALRVVLDPEDADSQGRWRIMGGEWQTGGAVLMDLEPGVLTVEFQQVTGWEKPGPMDVTVVAGETVVVTATYTRIMVNLSYQAGPNGSLQGDAEQVIPYGTSGAWVSAVPYEDCRFVEWSDGRTDNPRRDTEVVADLEVTAWFEAIVPPEAWQVDILATGAVNDTLTFGMAEGASDGFDPGLDEEATPPLDGEPATFLRAGSGLLYRRDMRPETAQARWHLTVAAGGNSPIDLTWDPQQGFPGTGFLSLVEVVLEDDAGARGPLDIPLGDSALNMGAVTHVTVPAGEVRTWRIHYAPHLVADLFVGVGWNLKALPLQPLNSGVDAVLNPYSAVGRTDPEASRPRPEVYLGSVWTWQQGRYVSAEVMLSGQGYWIYGAADTVFMVEGLPAPSDARPLIPGWNLVGVSEDTPVSVVGPVLGPAWWWSHTARQYRNSDLLVPFHGFWLNAAE